MIGMQMEYLLFETLKKSLPVDDGQGIQKQERVIS